MASPEPICVAMTLILRPVMTAMPMTATPALQAAPKRFVVTAFCATTGRLKSPVMKNATMAIATPAMAALSIALPKSVAMAESMPVRPATMATIPISMIVPTPASWLVVAMVLFWKALRLAMMVI